MSVEAHANLIEALRLAFACEGLMPMLGKDGWWRVYTTSSGVVAGGPTCGEAMACAVSRAFEWGML